MRPGRTSRVVTLTNDNYASCLGCSDAEQETHGTLSRKNVSRNVEEIFCVLRSDLLIGIDTTEGLLNTEHAYVSVVCALRISWHVG